MLFTNLGLIDPLLRAIADEGYTEATPIQAQAIPHVIAGRDLLGLAQTGTGKTAAFALPILQRLAGGERKGKGSIRVLIITPTRELASQIAESFAAYGRHLRFTHTVVFGGVGQRPQEDALRRGVDVLVATPGRLLDLMGQGFVKLADLEVFVLDEADRMLDMGFIPDVKRIIAALPTKRQTLFFSATMPPAAQQLADRLLHNPVKVAVVPPSTTVEKVSQTVYFVPKEKKRSLLIHLVADKSISRALVFTRTKHGANRVAEGLVRAGVESEAIHGNKSQSARERALAGFKSGRVRVLVATDIAARGIDVDEVSHVINFDLPNIPESYVHRIGRTARAGASGIAISFCDEGEERVFLRDIEREIRSKIPISVTPPLAAGPAEPDRPRGDRGGRSSQRGGGGGGGGYGGGGGRGGSGRGGSRPHGNAPARASSGGGGGGASSDRAPTRLARPEGAGSSDPSWSRFSYSSTSTPAAPRPAGGGKKRGSGGGGRSGGGSHRGR